MNLFKIAYGFALLAWTAIILAVLGVGMAVLLTMDAALFWIAVVVLSVALGAIAFAGIGRLYFRHNDVW